MIVIWTVTQQSQRSPYLKDASPMALELAHFTGQSVPADSVEHLTTDVAVRWSTVGACEPAVLPLKVLESLQHTLRGREEGRERERERKEGRDGGRGEGERKEGEEVGDKGRNG